MNRILSRILTPDSTNRVVLFAQGCVVLVVGVWLAVWDQAGRLVGKKGGQR